MEKIIRIDDREVRLNNNIEWAFEYRGQFGRDIVPALMPLIAGAIEVVGGVLEEIGTGKEIEMADVLQALSGERLSDTIIQLSQFEITDFINIIWAMARTADPSTPEPRTWRRQFETFPLDEITPVAAELIIAGLTSTKNWQRLQTKVKKSLEPKE